MRSEKCRSVSLAFRSPPGVPRPVFPARYSQGIVTRPDGPKSQPDHASDNGLETRRLGVPVWPIRAVRLACGDTDPPLWRLNHRA